MLYSLSPTKHMVVLSNYTYVPALVGKPTTSSQTIQRHFHSPHSGPQVLRSTVPVWLILGVRVLGSVKDVPCLSGPHGISSPHLACLCYQLGQRRPMPAVGQFSRNVSHVPSVMKN